MNEEKITPKWLKSLRQAKKLTQAQLGSVLNVSGTTVRYWECGRVKIPEKYFDLINEMSSVGRGETPQRRDEKTSVEAKLRRAEIIERHLSAMYAELSQPNSSNAGHTSKLRSSRHGGG